MASKVPQDFLKSWDALKPETKEAFRNCILAVEKGSVKFQEKDSGCIEYQSKSPFLSLPPEHANTVQVVNPRTDKMEQVEAVLEMITRIKQEKLPRGIVLNQKMASGVAQSSGVQIPQGFEHTTSVLGKGNSAGEVIIVKDRKTGQELALKTISIAQFNKDEIYMWINLGDAGMAPELYHFELKENKVFFTMRIMTGSSLQVIMNEKMMEMQVKDAELARSFSLCILHDLLKIQDHMRENKFIHGDIHGGNFQLEYSMDVKIFDFGRARRLLTEDDKKRLVKSDVVNLIRVFCCMYSGFDFNDSFEALKILTAQKLHELNPYMIRISESQRKEMYKIMTELFDTVRDWRKEGYGDTSHVASTVGNLIQEDMDEIKRKAAVIIFPEKFQNCTETDNVDFWNEGCESDVPEPDLDRDSIWYDEHMEDFKDNVTDEKLLELLGVGHH